MKVLAFSGSPIRDGNLEKAIKEILAAVGEPSEFIRLAELQIRPCLACRKCVETNRCIQKDDMSVLLDRIREAPALIIGGFPTFFSLNALTKTFIERLSALKHNHMLTRGKLGISVACGFRDAGKVLDYLNSFFDWFQMIRIGSLQVPGCMPCLTCGFGEKCAYSNVKICYGDDAKINPAMFPLQEQQQQTLREARRLGEHLRGKLYELR